MVVALGFLVAYVLYASDRAARLPGEAVLASSGETPPTPAQLVLSSSKAMAQPVFNASEFARSSTTVLSSRRAGVMMAGSQSAVVVLTIAAHAAPAGPSSRISLDAPDLPRDQWLRHPAGEPPPISAETPASRIPVMMAGSKSFVVAPVIAQTISEFALPGGLRAIVPAPVERMRLDLPNPPRDRWLQHPSDAPPTISGAMPDESPGAAPK